MKFELLAVKLARHYTKGGIGETLIMVVGSKYATLPSLAGLNKQMPHEPQ